MTTKAPKKTAPQFNAASVERLLQQRANLLPNITPELLASWHASFRRGNLRAAAIAWEQILQTDDTLVSVAPKREKAVSRHGFEIITTDDSAKAKRHAKTLEEFYNNLTATNAIDRNERGGFKMLVRQMMKSVGMKYSTHEIVWRPGPIFTAEFRHVPLWFFENTTGKLRFLPNGYGTTGEDMADGEWMTTTGDGIMAASAACWLFKHLPTQDMLIFSERYGFPMVWGESPDKVGSDGWNSMCDALAGIAGGEEVVVTAGSRLNIEEFKAAGNLPYEPLINMMKQALATMWRGGDLSTMSSDAVGAEMQDEEKDTLENDDAANITDVLNEQVDKHVIRYVHGDSVPLAWVKVKENIKQDTEMDLKIDGELDKQGFTEPIEEKQKRYGRPHLQPKAKPETGNLKPEEEALKAAANEDPTRWQRFCKWVAAGNTKSEDPVAELKKNSRVGIAQAIELDHRPIAASLAELLDSTEDDDFFQALENWRTETLPGLAAQVIEDPAAAEAYEEALSASLINGYVGDSE